MRSQLAVISVLAVMLAGLPVPAGAFLDDDVAAWNPWSGPTGGTVRVGEHGTCETGPSGRGLYADFFRPADRGPDSTYTLETGLLSAVHGLGIMQLCGYLTTSAVPAIFYVIPWADPDEPTVVRGYGYSSCFDSKGYRGRGQILYQDGTHYLVEDFGWKASSAHKIVALGRWRSASQPDVSGQMAASFAVAGGAGCFAPDGAIFLGSVGAHTLTSGPSATWNDVTDPVVPKSGPISPWGRKTRS